MPDPLRQRAQARLAALRQDLSDGRAQLTHLRDILPKIEGAVQVLEELLESATTVVKALDDATELAQVPLGTDVDASPIIARED